MTMKLEDLDFDHVTYEEVTINKNKTIIIPRYMLRDMPQIRLPNIELLHYGVPKAGRFFATDKDRMFIQVPLDGFLLEWMREFDTFLGSNEMKQKLFKSPGNTFTYTPIVKTGYKGQYMKIKLESDYESNEIETVVWVSTKKEDGSIQREIVPTTIDNLDHFASVVCLNSTLVCVVKLVKIWVVNKQYGLTIKLMQVNALHNPKATDESCDIDFDF